jgi:hypothetical protein
MSEELAHYSFLPFVRLGLSADITDVDDLGAGTVATLERASVTVEARINDTVYTELTKSILLIGPGDVTGIQSKAIVRCSPPNGTRNFEPNYLPYIEFYEEDFLWRYTPAKAKGNQLRPWLQLLVLKADEFERESTLTGPLQAISLTATGLQNAFPEVNEAWAWAHVHVNEDIDPTDTKVVADAVTALNAAVTADANVACCRLVSSRRLEASTKYTCFLVPAFETGRLAGLGESTTGIKAQQASWGSGTTASRHPYYYTWAFNTGKAGDFESLVDALMPRVMDNSVGKQLLDIQNPGFGVHYSSGNGSVKLEGALRILGIGSTNPLTFAGAATLAEDIRKVLDLSESVKETAPTTTAGTDANSYWSQDVFGLAKPKQSDADPVVTPPLYGCWHAQVTRLTNPLPATTSMNWLHQLNLDPTLRVAAGLGAEVVRKNQEAYMKAAWDQVGDVMEANRKLREAQMAKEIAGAIFRKHLKAQSSERLFCLSQRYHGRLMQGTTTVWQNARGSALGSSTQTGPFRRIVRPSGPIMKHVSPTATVLAHSNLVKGLAAGSILAMRAKKTSTFQNTVALSSWETLFNYPKTKNLLSSTRFALNTSGLQARTVTSNSEATKFKTATAAFSTYFSVTQWPAPVSLSTLSLSVQATAIRNALNPATAIPARFAAQITIGGNPRTVKSDRIDTVMACPKLMIPTYEPLVKLSTDYLLPNLKSIPDDTISLLEVNQPFIEAYLAGMNHEMMRELLWREYPTDQRGTVFQWFWDGADYDAEGIDEEERQERTMDIKEMHSWSKSAKIGFNSPRAAKGTTAKLVLVIRGELLRRYPNTMITAVQAQWATDPTTGLIDKNLPRTLTTVEKFPLFTAEVKPDVTMIGFDMTATTAHGMLPTTVNGKTVYVKSQPGWFFVLEERVGEVRFGMDESDVKATSKPATYDDLHWGHATLTNGHIDVSKSTTLATATGDTLKWGQNSANMAYVLYQDPVRVAVHAADMMPFEQA